MKNTIDISGNRVTIPIADLLEVAQLAIGGMNGLAVKHSQAIQNELFHKTPDGPTVALAASNIRRLADGLEKATSVYNALYYAAKRGEDYREELVIIREMD